MLIFAKTTLHLINTSIMLRSSPCLFFLSRHACPQCDHYHTNTVLHFTFNIKEDVDVQSLCFPFLLSAQLLGQHNTKCQRNGKKIGIKQHRDYLNPL